jgi:CheY-like chemotaxis protein
MAYALLVDDNEFLRTVMADKLKQAGVNIQQAANGLEGLEKSRQEPPAVIVLDENMPKMSGQEFFAAAKAEPWFKDVRIIVYTSLHSSDLVTHKQLAGVTVYLDKDVTSPETVASLVQDYMQPGRSGDAAQRFEPKMPPGMQDDNKISSN